MSGRGAVGALTRWPRPHFHHNVAHRSTLMMVLQAQSGIAAGSTDMGPTPSPLIPAPALTPDELANQLAISKGQVRAKETLLLHPGAVFLVLCDPSMNKL
jgi:hypothetical protein